MKQRLVKLCRCAKKSCGNIFPEDEMTQLPVRGKADQTEGACPKCGNRTHYLHNADGGKVSGFAGWKQTLWPPNERVQGYVLGFIFSPDSQRVLLIRKARPEWQKGKLNGVGGKIEPGETPEQAMGRELREEANGQWLFDCVRFARLTGAGWFVECFAAHGHIDAAETMDPDEPVEAFPICELRPFDPRMIKNLSWLIPMALDSLQSSGPKTAEAIYG